MGSILSKGIGSLVLKEYTDWNRIKNIAKRNGIYTAAGVAKLIVEHSPIKSVGEMKLQWATKEQRCIAIFNPKRRFRNIRILTWP
mgnify:CR=1 FL=1